MAHNPCICFISQAYPDFEGAYRGIFIKNLARDLIAGGYSVVVVTPKIYKVSQKKEGAGRLQVYRFGYPSGGKPLICYSRIPFFRMSVYMMACALKTSYVMGHHSCHLIHVHWIHPNGVVGVLAKYLFRCPLVIHVRGSDFNLFATRNRFFRALTHFILTRADHIFCASKGLKNGIRREFPRINEKRITVIYNSVDTSRFHPLPEKEAQKTLGLTQKGLHLLFVGNLVQEKGIPALIHAVETARGDSPKNSVTLHIVGSGPLADTLKGKTSQTREGEIAIILHGAVPHEQIPLWLNAAHALILPSEWEGTPNVMLEAIHCGIPVIATDVGDISRFIIDGENGFIIRKEGKEKHLRALFHDFMVHPDRLFSMKKRLQEKILVKKTVSEGDQSRIEQVYISLLGGSPRE